jgi:hypothetical protein
MGNILRVDRCVYMMPAGDVGDGGGAGGAGRRRGRGNGAAAVGQGGGGQVRLCDAAAARGYLKETCRRRTVIKPGPGRQGPPFATHAEGRFDGSQGIPGSGWRS